MRFAEIPRFTVTSPCVALPARTIASRNTTPIVIFAR